MSFPHELDCFDTDVFFTKSKRINFGKNCKDRNYTDTHLIKRPKQIKDANFKMTSHEPWARPKTRQALLNKKNFRSYVRGRRRRLLKNSIDF